MVGYIGAEAAAYTDMSDGPSMLRYTGVVLMIAGVAALSSAFLMTVFSVTLLGVLMFFGISLLILGWPVILALGGVFLFFLVRKLIQGRSTEKIHSL